MNTGPGLALSAKSLGCLADAFCQKHILIHKMSSGFSQHRHVDGYTHRLIVPPTQKIYFGPAFKMYERLSKASHKEGVLNIISWLRPGVSFISTSRIPFFYLQTVFLALMLP